MTDCWVSSPSQSLHRCAHPLPHMGRTHRRIHRPPPAAPCAHLHCKDAALLQYLEGQLYAIYQQAAVLCALVEPTGRAGGSGK